MDFSFSDPVGAQAQYHTTGPSGLPVSPPIFSSTTPSVAPSNTQGHGSELII